MMHVLVGCYKLPNLNPHPLVLTRTLLPTPLRLLAQPRQALPRLRDHTLQSLMLFSPNGQLQHDRFEFMMEIARRPMKLINLSM